MFLFNFYELVFQLFMNGVKSLYNFLFLCCLVNKNFLGIDALGIYNLGKTILYRLILCLMLLLTFQKGNRYIRIMAQSVSSSAGKKLIRIDVSSDTVCPWCFVGKRNLDKAIASSKDQYDFEVHSILSLTWTPTHPLFSVCGLIYSGANFADQMASFFPESFCT